MFLFSFNTSLIKAKIDILENYAKKNQLHKLRMDDLFEIRLINELMKNRRSVKMSSKSLSLFAWTHIYFDIKEIINKSNHTLMDVKECRSWLDIFKLSCLYNQIPECYCGPFSELFKDILIDMKDDKDAIKVR
ncbi:hypothetical protein, variant [Plasmodium falciparum MaliPS096_E11]|uniref:Uncharacterized protein n=1 Tax=Plasmodium falciparum MaliPS096_E11 TaxID=1036727 RepID=A0A024WPN9_PLAFA|nr:hypothetical protein, variant [Plasmodium falciparum MaliPS096_E11]